MTAMLIRNNRTDIIEVIPIRQHFKEDRIDSVEDAMGPELSKLAGSFNRGATIAVTAGSRGISNIDKIIGYVVRWVRDQGGKPFIIPAMGSHGGATAEGQKELLARYHISEVTMGCPIKSSMEVVEISRKESSLPVYMDKYAYEADGVILVNRVKPHSNFHGAYESGLVKMATIGLGKHRQAFAIHTFGTKGMLDFMPAAAKDIFASGKIVGGIAIMENAYDETARIEALKTADILHREPELLDIARQYMPRLPVKDIDVLVVEQIGKNISGVGMDPNITGRIRVHGQKDTDYPAINSIYVRDLTEQTYGNALGIGLADVISRALFKKIDYAVMYENVYTSGNYERVKVPLIADTDEQAMAYALRQNRETPAGQARIIRIKDTLHLQDMFVSLPVWKDIKNNRDIEVIGKPIKMFVNSTQMFNFDKMLNFD